MREGSSENGGRNQEPMMGSWRNTKTPALTAGAPFPFSRFRAFVPSFSPLPFLRLPRRLIHLLVNIIPPVKTKITPYSRRLTAVNHTQAINFHLARIEGKDGSLLSLFKQQHNFYSHIFSTRLNTVTLQISKETLFKAGKSNRIKKNKENFST